MAWKIEHEYDTTYRAITTRFTDVVLSTPADVERWRIESESHDKALG